LSGGERNRVHLAKLLRRAATSAARRADNDLDVDTLRALEEALLNFAGCACYHHDRWFLDRIATHMLASEGDQPGRLVPGNIRTTKWTASAGWAAAADPRSDQVP